MRLKEIAQRMWRPMDALARATDADPLIDLALRVERLEGAMADLDKRCRSSTQDC